MECNEKMSLQKVFFFYKRCSFLETTANKKKQSINVHKTERDRGRDRLYLPILFSLTYSKRNVIL